MNNNSIVFKNLNKKLKYYSSNKFTEDIVSEMVEQGKQYLAQEYASNFAIEGIAVGGKVQSNTTGTIYAQGKEVAFEEFGTGKVGQKSNYPKEKLPTQTLVFESPKGHIQTTIGWVYYYPNKYTKVKNLQGRYGWRYNGQFTRGMPAGKQVYNTAKFLRNNITQIAKKVVREKV